MHPYSGRIHNALDKTRFRTALMKRTEIDLRLEHSDKTSSAAPRLNNSNTIVSRNRADAVLVQVEAALFSNCKLSTDEDSFDFSLDLCLSAFRVNAIIFLRYLATDFAPIDHHHDVVIVASVFVFCLIGVVCIGPSIGLFDRAVSQACWTSTSVSLRLNRLLIVSFQVAVS